MISDPVALWMRRSMTKRSKCGLAMLYLGACCLGGCIAPPRGPDTLDPTERRDAAPMSSMMDASNVDAGVEASMGIDASGQAVDAGAVSASDGGSMRPSCDGFGVDYCLVILSATAYPRGGGEYDLSVQVLNDCDHPIDAHVCAPGFGGPLAPPVCSGYPGLPPALGAQCGVSIAEPRIQTLSLRSAGTNLCWRAYRSERPWDCYIGSPTSCVGVPYARAADCVPIMSECDPDSDVIYGGSTIRDPMCPDDRMVRGELCRARDGSGRPVCCRCPRGYINRPPGTSSPYNVGCVTTELDCQCVRDDVRFNRCQVNP